MGSRLTVLLIAVALSVAFLGAAAKVSPAQTAIKEVPKADTQAKISVQPKNTPYCGPSYTALSQYMKIGVQVNQRTGTIAWGAYMRDPSKNDGPWKVSVRVSGDQLDFKKQGYPPHGSLRATAALKRKYNNPVFRLDIIHQDEDTGRTYSEPANGCVWGAL